MVSTSFLFVFILGGLLVATMGQVKKVTDLLTWSEARSACQSRFSVLGSCDLITKERLGEKWRDLDLSSDNPQWVGARRLYAWHWDQDTDSKLPLVQHHGCYKVTVDNALIVDTAYNGPQQCYQACRRQGFLYLQGNKCYCASSLEGQAVSRKECSSLCEGSNHQCGKKDNYFSVYSIPEQIVFQDDDTSLDCAVGQIQGFKLSVQSTNCRSSQDYFCESDVQNEEPDVRREYHETAVSRCYRRGSVLPGVKAHNQTTDMLTQIKTVTDKLDSSSSFWLALQRTVKIVWLDGVEGENEGGRYGDCLAVTPRIGTYRLNDVSCSDTRPAICYCTSVTDSIKKVGDTIKTNLKTIAIAVTVSVLVVVFVVAVIIFLWKRIKSNN